MWGALKQGVPWKGEFYNRRKDGTEYVEFAIITPLRQPDGSISHYVAVKEDVTEKKRIGIELDNHRHHLRDLVELRTAELTLARQQVETANIAKSAFLAEYLPKFLAEHHLPDIASADPDTFTRWIFPHLFHSRIPRYEAIARPHGYTVTSREVAQIRDENDFLTLLEAAIGRT
jgi:hypothetical protein